MSQQYRAPGYKIAVRPEYTNNVGMLGKVTTHIGEVDGDITAVDLVRSSRGRIVRDLTMNKGMKLAAPEALANIVPVRDLSEEYIIPSVFNQRAVPSIARRRHRRDQDRSCSPRARL